MLFAAKVLLPQQELCCSSRVPCFPASVSERVSMLVFAMATCLRRRDADEGMAPKEVLSPQFLLQRQDLGCGFAALGQSITYE